MKWWILKWQDKRFRRISTTFDSWAEKHKFLCISAVDWLTWRLDAFYRVSCTKDLSINRLWWISHTKITNFWSDLLICTIGDLRRRQWKSAFAMYDQNSISMIGSRSYAHCVTLVHVRYNLTKLLKSLLTDVFECMYNIRFDNNFDF